MIVPFFTCVWGEERTTNQIGFAAYVSVYTFIYPGWLDGNECLLALLHSHKHTHIQTWKLPSTDTKWKCLAIVAHGASGSPSHPCDGFWPAEPWPVSQHCGMANSLWGMCNIWAWSNLKKIPNSLCWLRSVSVHTQTCIFIQLKLHPSLLNAALCVNCCTVHSSCVTLGKSAQLLRQHHFKGFSTLFSWLLTERKCCWKCITISCSSFLRSSQALVPHFADWTVDVTVNWACPIRCKSGKIC